MLEAYLIAKYANLVAESDTRCIVACKKVRECRFYLAEYYDTRYLVVTSYYQSNTVVFGPPREG